MTTTKQIKELFRPLLDRNPDLVQIGNSSLWLKPVRHVAMRIAVDRTSEADQFRPRWSAEAIFSARPDFYLGPGRHVGDFLPDRHDPLPSEYWKDPDLMRQVHDMLRQRRLWRWSDAAIPAQFVKVVESEVLPMLRPLSQYEDFYHLHQRDIVPYGMVHPETQILMDIAYGDLDSARETWRRLFHRYEVDLCAGLPVVQPLSSRERRRMSVEALAEHDRAGACKMYRWRREKYLAVGPALFRGDRPALAAILHRWEAETVRGSPYEAYWEATPFPLEA
jgi:hypothetical protein